MTTNPSIQPAAIPLVQEFRQQPIVRGVQNWEKEIKMNPLPQRRQPWDTDATFTKRKQKQLSL
jgi:hypothetical protein